MLFMSTTNVYVLWPKGYLRQTMNTCCPIRFSDYICQSKTPKHSYVFVEIMATENGSLQAEA